MECQRGRVDAEGESVKLTSSNDISAATVALAMGGYEVCDDGS